MVETGPANEATARNRLMLLVFAMSEGKDGRILETLAAMIADENCEEALHRSAEVAFPNEKNRNDFLKSLNSIRATLKATPEEIKGHREWQARIASEQSVSIESLRAMIRDQEETQS